MFDRVLNPHMHTKLFVQDMYFEIWLYEVLRCNLKKTHANLFRKKACDQN